MPLIFRSIFFTLLLTLLALCGTSQQFNFRNYSVGEGLAQSQVFGMLEDSRGFLWMGTRGGGVSRFDGRDFSTFSTKDGLVNNFILCLFEDSNGNIWIGTNNGLSKYDGLQFKNFYLKKNTPVSVSSICEDKDGKLWIGSAQGVFTISGAEINHYSKEFNYYDGHISIIFRDTQNQIWIGSDGGLSKVLPNGNTQTWTKQDGLSNNFVRAICEDANGNYWISTYGQGINVFDGETFATAPSDFDLRPALVLSIFRDSKDFMWMATQNYGVLQWNPADSSLVQISESDGLCNNHVRTILEDSWGNIWFGTSGGGVSRYTGQQFVHYNQSDGLSGNYVYSVMQDSEGRLWTGTSGLGITVQDSSGFDRIGADDGFRNVKVKALYEDRNCRIWLGTEGLGLALKEDSTFRFFNGNNGLSGNWIKQILQGDSSQMWVATAGGGITQMIPKDSADWRFRYYTTSKGMPQSRVSAIHFDGRQRLWFSTPAKGIGFIRKNVVEKVLTEANGLARNGVRSITEKGGFLWLGTAGGGVARMTLYGPKFEFDTITTADGLTSGNIYLMAWDEQGNLWVGTETGLDRISFDDTYNVIEIKHFGKAEGFVGIETSQNAVCKDVQGNLWFGTIAGLTKYKPGGNLKNEKAPITSISQINLFYEPLSKTSFANWVTSWNGLKPGLELPYDQNHLGFEFSGVNHKNPDKVLFRWKLEGLDKDWSPPGANNSATYANLPPGAYTFMVKARNEDGVWNKKPEQVSFTILPPFWQTWWFMGGCIFLGLLIIGLIFRVRVSQLKKEKEKLLMEKDLLQLEQKALRLQMNPHFIFNALNSIQALITLKDEKTARYFLAKFSRLMRAILENSRESMIPLEQEIGTLESYLSLEQFSRDNQFNFSIEVDESVEVEDSVLPPMMIQPFVENAIIHGVAHLSDRKGQINLFFTMQNNILICTVEDNGIGREKATQINSQREHTHKSTALLVTQERLDLMHPEGKKIRSIEVEDRTDESGSPSGTVVVIRVPIGSA